jgi:hypothetical protein
VAQASVATLQDGGIFDPTKKDWTQIKQSFDAPHAYPFTHAVGQKVFIVERKS